MSDARGGLRKEGEKKRSNLSPPFKLNKSTSRPLPQAARRSSDGSSVAVRRLFCARKLGRSSESCCYSRKGSVFFFSLSPSTSTFLSSSPPHLPVLISLISPERKRCLAYCSSEGEETALPFPFISSPTGVMFARAPPPSAVPVSFREAGFFFSSPRWLNRFPRVIVGAGGFVVFFFIGVAARRGFTRHSGSPEPSPLTLPHPCLTPWLRDI